MSRTGMLNVHSPSNHHFLKFTKIGIIGQLLFSLRNTRYDV